VPHGDGLRIITGGQQRRFIDQVRQVGPGKARCAPGNNTNINSGIQRDFLIADMDVQDFLPPFNIRIGHNNLPVKTAGTQQRVVQHIRPVGGRHQNDTIVGIEPVHLNKQLVQCLFTFIMTAAKSCAPLAAYGVYFIDKYDTGSIFVALLKQVTYAAGPHAHKHFHEIGPADTEERDVGFARNRLGKQRLA